MPLRSMTGVGQVTLPVSLTQGGQARTASLEVELRSVNSRFLECIVKTPLKALQERELQRRVNGALGRGRVEVRMGLHQDAGSDDDPEKRIDEARLRALLEDLASIDRTASSHWMQLAPVNALEILRELRVSRGAAPATGISEFWEDAQSGSSVDDALSQALAKLVGMRETEGKHLEAQIREESAVLRQCLQDIEARREAMVPQIEQRLRERLNAVLGGPEGDRVHEVGEARVAQELAVVLGRADVQEELIRIDAHLLQVHEILDEYPNVGQGKRLNFLCQELGREWSTVGAKFSDAEASALIVSAKSSIERIREQAQNVE